MKAMNDEEFIEEVLELADELKGSLSGKDFAVASTALGITLTNIAGYCLKVENYDEFVEEFTTALKKDLHAFPKKKD